MYNPFRQNCVQQPFLSPLGKHRRSLPGIAAPLAVIIIGGVALVVAFGALLSGMTTKTDSAVAAIPVAEDQIATPQTPSNALTETISDSTTSLLQSSAAEQTAALPPTPATPETQALSFNAPVADSEADIAVLEVIQIAPVEDEAEAEAAASDKNAPEAPLKTAQAPASSGLKIATTNGAVNLRAAPDKNAEVLLVIPKEASIEAQNNCTWCAVTYQGNQGYIYKSFIDYR